ncbi:hypothetical protein BaRGS_00018982 [Batillaria attramentaria]|uniref:Novel STAND NTPase 3 domain-containing protein n=1 Tax=Batillaria attramentaria TaxID=370345 RepID=A0ABD0KRQ4_9CAEN
MSGNTKGDGLALLPESEDSEDDVTEGGATSGDVTVPKQVATTSETPSEMASSDHPVVVKMSDQQEGHLHMGNEVNTTYNQNHVHHNITCGQVVVHTRYFCPQTVNNNNRDNPDRREQDSVADPDSSHSNTFHYIHTDDLQEAEVILEERHLVILCGPPGSGKTTLGRALLQIYRDKGYQVYIIAHVHELSGFIRGGGRSVVLMDGALGEVRLDETEYRALRSVQQPLQESVRRGNCLLVITVYPHVLRELRQLDARGDMLLLQPACLVEILADPLPEEVKTAMIKFHLQELHLDMPEQDALVTEILQKDVSGAAFPWCCRQMVKEWQSMADSTVFFAAPAQAHVHFLQHMLRDPKHGETMAVVMSLTMLGLSRFLHDPYRVQSQLEKLGFRDASNYSLEEYSDVLKDFILHKTESRFEGRVWYDAVGLALGQSFSLPILLKVCDVRFLVQHVRTKETATEFVTIGPSTDDRQLLMQTMYEHMVSGRLPELCQHPSLHCPQFLQEFDEFCRANKNCVQQLVSAVDTVHRKPLLYWSVWGPTGNLTQWCLKLTEGDIKYIVRGGWLAQVLLACKLVGKATEEEDNSLIMLLATLMSAKKMRDMIQTGIDLPLPSTEQYTPRSFRAKMDQVMSTIQTNSLCYLDDPSLPIPNTLVSMEVRSSDDGDNVHVVVPSKQWYLALRLLADRQVDERDEEGNTLLHVAADSGDLDVVKIAVKSGASLTARNNKGHNPPQLAVNRKKREKKKTGTSFDCIDALHKACRSGDQNTVKVLVCTSVSVQDKVNTSGSTPLHVACETGKTDVAILLISLDADVNVKDNYGYTPLHFACNGDNTQTALLLIQHHADVNVKDNGGHTPLHRACDVGNTQTALLLIQHHADVNVKNNDGHTPLHYACLFGNTQTAVLLIQHDADVNLKNNHGDTPLHYDCFFDNTQTALLLIQHHADLNVKNNDWCTPLHYACLFGNTQTALLLIQHHADVNARTKTGDTPLDVALYSQDANMVGLLIQHGATVKRKRKHIRD